MVIFRLLLPIIVQCIIFLVPVMPTTSYTQVNHEVLTNGQRGTTVTSDFEELREPGVEEKDLLWDHVGDLTQHFLLRADDRSTTGSAEDINTTATLMINQMENSVNLSNREFNVSLLHTLSHKEEGSPFVNSSNLLTPSSTLLPLSTLGSEGRLEPEMEKIINRSDIQGKLILYPTDDISARHTSGYAIGNITKTLRKSLIKNTTKKYHLPKQIIYDTSDPFSVIFGEVKTQFITDKSINVSQENRENIVGGLAVRKVEQLLKEEDQTRDTLKEKNIPTKYKDVKVLDFQEEKDHFDSEQEEEELHHRSEIFEFGQVKTSPNERLHFPKYDTELHTSEENNKLGHLQDEQGEKNSFKEWDTVSEEQEKMLENIVLENHNRIEGSAKDALPPAGRWFILLLAGNSTIVKLRQKDFAKYLKLNLAARLSVEYDEVKVNRVVLAPPRLMVNVSVIPANDGKNQYLDEEIDLEDKVFGEEEAPLYKLAETNATLLELSGEEYHVVRFLSLRSQQPIQMEDTPSATSSIVNDRHMDIETIIMIFVGGACLISIFAGFCLFIYQYFKLILMNWSWREVKPMLTSPWTLSRHQRMGEDTGPSIGGPLTVIYSGNFVERTGSISGSWIDDQQPSTTSESLDLSQQHSLYSFGALNNTALSETTDPFSSNIQDSPRINQDSKLHILGCQPNHLLLPHQPSKTNIDHKATLDVRIPSAAGVDNPNYQS